MERLKNLYNQILSATEGQVCNLSEVNYEELGAAMDMIKDLSETMYYCSIVKAMEEGNKNEQAAYYSEGRMAYPYLRAMDLSGGRLYYDSNWGDDSTNTEDSFGSWNRNYNDNVEDSRKNNNMSWRDAREGKSPMRRKAYMESKAKHKDKQTTMEELEDYAQGLTSDIVEMIKDATPEEKNMLQQKIAHLASKIV